MQEVLCLEEINSFILKIYKTVNEDKYWTDVLKTISNFIPNSKVALTIRENKSGYPIMNAAMNFQLYNFNSKFVDQYIQHEYRNDVWLPVEQTLSVGQIGIFSELLEVSTLFQTEFYKSWLQPQKITDGIAIQLYKNQHTRVVLNLFFKKDPPQLQKLQNFLVLVKDHLSQAIQLKMGHVNHLNEYAFENKTRYLQSNYNLSKRELEVAIALYKYKHNQTVADNLHISLNTVKTHLKSIYKKMSISSSFDLISKFQESLI